MANWPSKFGSGPTEFPKVVVRNEPYWEADEQWRSADQSQVPTRVEIVVIGAGIMGLATAYWLARAGIQTLIIDAKRIASGATGRNVGMMLAGASPLEDPQLLQEVLLKEQIDAGFVENGHLALAETPMVWERFCEEAARRAQSVRPIHALNPRKCESLLGMQIHPRFLGGRWFPGGAVVHPTRFAYGLAKAAARYGAMILDHTPVMAVHECSDGIEVQTANFSVTAHTLVFACGVALPDFVPEFKPLIAPIRGQVCATAPLPPLFRFGMAVDFGSVYWRQSDDGAVVIGGMRSIDPEEETTTEPATNLKIQAALAGFLPEAFVDFPPAPIVRTWAGVMDFSPDERPLIGARPGAANQWIVAGFGGHGLPPALGAGRAITQTILGETTGPSLHKYDPGRFFQQQETSDVTATLRFANAR